MFLCYYILLGTTIVFITRAERASNQAVSSQSYNRGDVPLSYKNNFIHIYTSPMPHALNHSPHENKYYDQPKTIHQIQYAPLPLRTQEQQSDNKVRYTKISGYNKENNKNLSLGQEQNLEPRLINTQAPNYDHPRLPYVPGVPGHMLFQALKNRLIQSGLSVNNPNLRKNKQVNVKTLQPQVNYERPEGIQRVPQNIPLSATEGYVTPKPIHSVLANQYVQNAKKYNEEILPGVENMDRLPMYLKAPKVQLNVARSRIIAHAPYKASVKVNTNFKKLDSMPEEYFFKAQIIQPQNTKLVPAQKRNIFLIHRSV